MSAPVHLTLPDGSVRSYPAAVTGATLAADIGPGLAKAALAVEVEGVLRDLSHEIDADARVRLITAKDAEGIDLQRHSTAHILAQAVKEMYPSAQITIGPVIDHGFYYDVRFEAPLTPDDLPKIEARMKEVVARKLPVTRLVWARDEAVRFFKAQGEHYKAEIIADLPADETISLYQQGDGQPGDNGVFVDLCRGPHLPTTGHAGAFALTHLAGAYWRGDSNNEMLTRIYGLGFPTEKELKAHQTMLEEAGKRDHRKLGKELDLFHFQEEAPGQAFWHHKGWTIYRILENYMREKCFEHNYIEVNTPQVLDVDIWKTSGHWDKFRDNMYMFDGSGGVPERAGAGSGGVDGASDKLYGLKPMSCPGDIQVYNQHLHSYRDLPIRMAEFGRVFRNEASGAMHGLMRVRAFTQDDAHVFCTTAQMEDEVVAMVQLVREVYTDLGFPNFRVKFSDRPEMRLGTDDIWDTSEAALKNACAKAGIDTTYNPGEGAFYGPKLEFVLTDAIGRDWQCGTIQLDLNLPERFNMEYVGEDGNRHRPIMLHRAILGSLERFIGILIENTAGHLPLWLAPVQVVAAGITDAHGDYVADVVRQLKAAGLRASADLRNEKITYKIREHSTQKVPVILVAGDKEAAAGTVTVRRLGSDAQQTLAVADLIGQLQAEVAERRHSLAAEAGERAA